MSNSGDATTGYGMELRPGSIVTDMNSNITYLLTEAVAANQTLSTTTGKVEINDNCYLTNTISIAEFNPDKTCLSDASLAFISAFQSDKEIIFIPKGCYMISSSLTIPPGKTLMFEKGAKLDVKGGLSGSNTGIRSGINQIFTHTSDVDGTWSTNAAYCAWFGAKPDGGYPDTTLNRKAIQKTLNLFSGDELFYNGIYGQSGERETVVYLKAGTYYIDSTIVIPGYCNFEGTSAAQPPVLRNSPYMVEPVFYNKYGPVSMKNLEISRLLVSDMITTTGYNESWDWVQEWHLQRLPNGNRGYNRGFRRPIEFENCRLITPWFGDVNREPLITNGLYITLYDQYDAEYFDIWRGLDIYGKDTALYTQGFTMENLVYPRDTVIVTSSNVDVANDRIYAPDHGLCRDGIYNPERQVEIIYETDGSAIGGLVDNGNCFVYFPHKDSIQFKINLSSQGTGNHKFPLDEEGMVNSLMFTNYLADYNLHAFVSGHRAQKQMFNGMNLQVYKHATYGQTVQLDLGGFGYVFKGGVVWDMNCDSTAMFRDGVNQNSMDGWGAEDWKYRYTTFEGNQFLAQQRNFVGEHPMFNNYNVNSFDVFYKLVPNAIGLKDNGETGRPSYDTHLYNGATPVGVLSVANHFEYTGTTPKYTIVANAQSILDGTGDLDTDSEISVALALSMTTRHSTIRKGLGTAVDFFVRHNNRGIANPLNTGDRTARMMVKLDGADNDSTAGAFIFETGMEERMTIRSSGKVGIGITEPAYDLDLTNTGTFRSTNITDDGTDVKITGRTNLNILHLIPSNRPNSAIVGDMYLSSEDGNLYLYTNSGWKAVVLQ